MPFKKYTRRFSKETKHLQSIKKGAKKTQVRGLLVVIRVY